MGLMKFLRARVRSFGYAGRGIGVMLRTQPNAWVHLGASVLAVVAGFWVRLERWEWLWVVAAIGMVWVAEGVNTAIELVCDALHPEQHPLIGKAKDAAAGAVLIAAATAVVVGVVVFWPHVAK